jgi:multidrug efflux system membrane fusion protein
MRIFPILTALAVGAALYAVVFERDRLLTLAGRDPAAEVRPPPPDLAPPAEKSAEAVKPVRVVALASKARQVENALLVRGRTEALRQVEVRSETSGLVLSEPLRSGASVTAGEVLCRLDPGTREVSLAEARSRLAEAQSRGPEAEARIAAAEAALPEARARIPEAQARLAEARARLAEADLALRQAQGLSDRGLAPQNRLSAAQSAMESARAGVQSAEANVEAVTAGVRGAEAQIEQARAGLRSADAGVQAAEAGVAAAEREIARLEIRAPFGGLLETDSAERGSLLQPGGLCATIVQLDRIKLVGFVAETDIGRIATGAEAGARLADGTQVQGRVSFLSRAADDATRTFRLEVEVDNPGLEIRDGQTAEILIRSDSTVAHLLPASALTLDDGGRIGIRAVEGAVARFLPVAVLRDTTEGVWVTGLPETVDVIVVGQDFVTDGVAIEATWREAG